MKKRILSLVLVMTMVIAMTACGGKEEESDTGPADTKTEVTDDKKDDGAVEEPSAEKPVAPEELEISEESVGMTEEDIEAVKASIKEAVVKEYLEPNGIVPNDFVWPDSNSGVWDYFVELVVQHTFELAGTNREVRAEVIPSSPEKEIIDAAFNGFIKWFEASKKNDPENFGNSAGALQPYQDVIPAIDVTATE